MKITDVSSSSTTDAQNLDTQKEENSNRPTRRKKTLLEKFDIPVEELDFGFVNKCSDPIKIERILRILRSGEEGTYPDLEKAVVARLEELKPSSRLLRVETPALRTKELGKDQKNDIEKGLAEWLSNVEDPEGGGDAKAIFEADAHDNFSLPVRGSAEQKVTELKSQKFTTVNNSKEKRIKSWEYDKWDKFDADAELTKLDIADMQHKEWEKREKPNVIAEQKRIKKLMKADGESSDLSPLSTSSKAASSELPKPKSNRSLLKNEVKKDLGKSYIEELDSDDDGESGVQVTVPNRSFQNHGRAKIVIDDLNLGM